jgi:hypothetical protein
MKSWAFYSPLCVGVKSLSGGFLRSELFKREGLGERSKRLVELAYFVGFHCVLPAVTEQG